MDFDILVPGHGGNGSKADVAAHREYLNDLWTAVQAAVRAGKTVEQAQADIKLTKYAKWFRYKEWGPLNVAGAYKQFAAHSRRN